jgi:hypothetical protein
VQADADLEAETGALTCVRMRDCGPRAGVRVWKRVVVQWEGDVAGAERRWWWKRMSEGGE